MKAQGKAAWIIEWYPHRDDIGVSDIRPMILPRSWGKDRVMDVMGVVFWNSPLWAIFETEREIHKGRSQRLHIADSGRRIDFSEFGGTGLIGARVSDLRLGRHPSGGELMEWTLPPHLSRNEDGKICEITEWVPRSFRWNH
jgi:hypothetical protein